MKYLLGNNSKCSSCKLCEQICSQLYFGIQDSELSSIRIQSDSDTNKINVCNQCGICIDVCPVLAIKRNNQGIVSVDKNICIACYACIKHCPSHSMHKSKLTKVPFKCIACGSCVSKCPESALKFIKNP